MADSSNVIDLHIHTTVSDGTDTPEELLEKVRDAGISVFSVTDHDAVMAADRIRPLLTEHDPRFIPGVEFSCRDEKGSYHILGYGFDPGSKAIRNVTGLGHAFRIKKLLARLEYLEKTFGFSFPEEEIAALISLDNPGKPHIGNLMVKYGYAATKEQAINKYINRVYFANEYVRPEQAIEGITGAGGVPVLAHPFYGSGNDLILGEEMEKRLKRLIGYGLGGIEAFYSGFPAKLRKEALSIAEKLDLAVTAGSDYHGSNKLIRLGDTGLEEETKIPERLRRFLERVTGNIGNPG